mgnify:CR=1 FL=1
MDKVLSLSVIENAFKVLAEQEKLAGSSAASAADDHAGDPEAEEINALIAERTTAKKNKDFARADEIRNILTARGVTIVDTPNGPTWKRGKKFGMRNSECGIVGAGVTINSVGCFYKYK